jgi:hypothetical protein
MDIMMHNLMKQGGDWTVEKMVTALTGKYPHATFKKQSVAAAFTILIKANKVTRVDRGQYRAIA